MIIKLAQAWSKDWVAGTRFLYVGPSALDGFTLLPTWAYGPGWYMPGLRPCFPTCLCKLDSHLLGFFPFDFARGRNDSKDGNDVMEKLSPRRRGRIRVRRRVRG
jgi:hypothetical protein